MSATLIASSAPPRRIGRSIGAILAGLLTIFATCLAIDHVLHTTGVYPPYGEPMLDTGLNLLSLGYRTIISILGCYLTARLAPRNPMRHALILGAIGVVLSAVGAIGVIQAGLLATWNPIMLVIESLPCAWLGGALRLRKEKGRNLNVKNLSQTKDIR